MSPPPSPPPEKRRLWPNVAFAGLFACVLYISLWQISTGPQPQRHRRHRHATNATLQPDDYARLMDLGNFSFAMLGAVCEAPPLLLVLVHSSPRNAAKRAVIRETWGRRSASVKTLFLVGEVADRGLQAELEGEGRRHGDMAQGSFVDAYRNMTYKHVMALKYAVYHCAGARYVLKTDDDVFVNTPRMLEYLGGGAAGANLLMCNLFRRTMALRSYRSKWRVSFEEYPGKFYPDYCPGWAILYSQDVVLALYREAQRSRYFWIDDVLITGILAERVGVNHTDAEPMILARREQDAILRRENATATAKDFLYGTPNLSGDEIRTLWDFVLGAASD